MSERVTITIDEHVAVVSLNRPDKHNAVDLDMFAGLTDAGRELAGNSLVRAIVLQGAGPSFCAGIDLSIFQQGSNAIGAEKMTPGEDSPANFSSARPMSGVKYRCRLLLHFTAAFMAPACRLPWVRTSAMQRPIAVSQLWKSNGASSPTWQSA